jgi:ribose 5-phosphate isomerase B
MDIESNRPPNPRVILSMMKIAAGADDRTPITDALLAELRARGHEMVTVLGPAGERDEQWTDVGLGVAEVVARGDADNGIVCCWTGTGVTMAANKVAGVRAALCTDAQQARGARRYNDANVLGLSLRLTTEATLREILDAWFGQTELDPTEVPNINKLNAADRA